MKIIKKSILDVVAKIRRAKLHRLVFRNRIHLIKALVGNRLVQILKVGGLGVDHELHEFCGPLQVVVGD